MKGKPRARGRDEEVAHRTRCGFQGQGGPCESSLIGDSK